MIDDKIPNNYEFRKLLEEDWSRKRECCGLKKPGVRLKEPMRRAVEAHGIASG
jgi:hypothetical protein